VDGAHDTALDRSELVERVSHGSEAVGGAGCCADDGVGRGKGLVVGVVNDGREVISSRSGDDDLLCTGLDVSGSLSLGGIETSALENYIDVKLSPGKLSGVGLCIDGDFLSVHDDGTGSDNGFAVLSEDCILIIHSVFSLTELAGEAALGGVVLEEVGKHLGACEIIDGDYFVTISFEHLTESQTADTAKTVDCNSIHFVKNINVVLVLFLIAQKYKKNESLSIIAEKIELYLHIAVTI
jgi:hypothetical protein